MAKQATNQPDLNMGEEWDLENDDFFAQVYERYMPRVFYFFYSRIQNQADAEDLTSNVFMKALEKRGSFDPEKASFAIWIFSIARNQLIDYYRARRIHVPLTLELMEVGTGGIVSDAGVASEERELWTQMASFLSEKEMIVMRGRYHYGWNNRQIAKSAGINENTVSTLHRRALIKLKGRTREIF